MMTTLFGVSASDFLDGFYSLDSVNTSQIDAMTLIAQTMDEYLSCVVTSKDRFVGVGTEQQLEIRAGELNKKKQFFAGKIQFTTLTFCERIFLEKQMTLTLPVHLVSAPSFSGVRVAHLFLLLCMYYFGYIMFFVVCV